MQRIPDSPPPIAPLSAGIDRPFWSVMIPAYNCAVFLPEAIQSVLAQDPGEGMMQIEVVDDCSTDADVGELVKRVGKGRVLYYRQQENIGSLRNFETCINRARGHHIHLLHGDDRVKPGFYTSLKSLFDNFPDAGAAYCAWNYIDDQGNVLRPSRIEAEEECVIDNCLSLLAEQQLLQYVTIAVKREVYEKLGSFYGVTYGEDWIMWARIAKEYTIAYVPKILAEYREHESSISNNSFISGKNIRDISKVFSTINSYLPKEKQKKASLAARKTYAYWALGITSDIWQTTKNKDVVYAQLKEIVKLYKDPKVVRITGRLILSMKIKTCAENLKRILSINPKMNKILSATIVHLHLEDLAFKPNPKEYYYLVLWWHSIPLGDLYVIFDGQEQNNSELNKEIINAAAPAIDFYATANNRTQSNYQKEFLNGNYDGFKKIMGEIFSACLPVSPLCKVEVSVVICTRNRSQDLKLCIESLLKQTFLPEEIIVVDNAPTDDSTQIIAEQYKDVTYCREERPGLDIARNTGALKAKHQIVAYTDDDVQVNPLWTYRVWETFLKEDVDAMTGLVLAASLKTESQQIFEKHWAFNKGYIYKIYDKQFIKSNLKVGPKVWEIGAGANMAFRKSVLAKVGWFDERLDVGAAGCSGDSEVWFRILENNFNIHYNPQAVVYHEHRKELAKLHKQLFNYMRGFATAALIQHDQNKHAGYRKHLFYKLPQYYFYLLLRGFPFYKFNYQTVFSEVHGLLSGVKFYYQNRKKPSIHSDISKV